MTSDRSISAHGFSLIELLMSIMILAIGLISVAALFPAGIVQQQRAKDDMEGPAVAKSAIGVLRSRLAQEDFGAWSDFYTREQVDRLFINGELDDSPAFYLREGDWPWMRPAVADTTVVDEDYDGVVDVFNWLGYWNGTAATVTDLATDDDYYRYCQSRNLNSESAEFLEPLGIPYARDLADLEPPKALFTARDRRWPPDDGSGRAPQYHWDFMLSRSGGDVFAAVFVYRVVSPQGGATTWRVRPVDIDSQRQPAMPLLYRLDSHWQPGDGDGRTRPLPGTDSTFSPTDPTQSWQYPGQWVVDNIGSIHNVDRGRVRPDQVFEDGMGVRFSHKVPHIRLGGLLVGDANNGFNLMPQTLSHAVPQASLDMLENNPDLWAGGYPADTVPIVDRLWFVPRSIETMNSTGVQQQWELVPVYVLVERL